MHPYRRTSDTAIAVYNANGEWCNQTIAPYTTFIVLHEDDSARFYCNIALLLPDASVMYSMSEEILLYTESLDVQM